MNRADVRRRLLVGALCIVVGLTAVAGCGVSGKKPNASRTTQAPNATTQAPTASPTTSGPASGPWVLVTDKPTGYSFRLPKQPTQLHPDVTAPDGVKVTVRGYQAMVTARILVQVSVYDLNGRSFDADKAIKGVAIAAHGSVTKLTHTRSGKLDIADAKFHIAAGPALGYDRVFKIGDHAVQLWTLGPAGQDQRVRAVQQRLSSTFRTP